MRNLRLGPLVHFLDEEARGLVAAVGVGLELMRDLDFLGGGRPGQRGEAASASAQRHRRFIMVSPRFVFDGRRSGAAVPGSYAMATGL